MSKITSFEKYQKRRLRSSYLSVVISIALVLFLLGLLGLLIFHTKNISNHFKEKYAINIFIKDSAKEKDIENLKKTLQAEVFTKTIKFVSKDQALEIYKKEIGEDFMEFLGENPLKSSIDLFLKAAYVSADKIQEIEKNIIKNKFVEEVTYDKSLVSLLNKSVKKISFWLLIFSGLLSLIAIVLINSYLRLSIYSKRFIIKTMQMVGATKSFIRKPFLYRSVKLGMVGAVVAIGALNMLLFYMDKKYPDLGLTDDKLNLSLLFLGVFILGMVITWLSTFFATKRFLNLTADELHY
jgi:cell division transport system permease protein